MTGIMSKSVYEYSKMYNLLPVEKKECRTNSSGTRDQLLIYKKGKANLEMIWIDYNKAHDMSPNFRIFECLYFVQVSENIMQFVRKSI